MLGAIIGDIVGSTRERHNVKTERFELLPEGSRYTDDTAMTLAVALWLMTDDQLKAENLVTCMQTIGRRHIHRGYGHAFKKWLVSDNPQPYGSYGNGSAMRVSPVALYAKTMEQALDLAQLTAIVTHNHPEGIKGAQAMAACVFIKSHGGSDEEMKSYVEKNFGYDLSADLRSIRPYYGFDSSCKGSVPIGIMAYLQRDKSDPLGALRLAVSMGGDSDTIADMAFAIAAAEYPQTWMKDRETRQLEQECRKLLTPDMLKINDRFEAFICQRRKAAEEYDRSLQPIPAEIRQDKVRGCLMAGAMGDALGYPVEFMTRKSILTKYGAEGIRQFELDKRGKAQISDDTQMTLFTANGMLNGATLLHIKGLCGNPKYYARDAYKDWYETQTMVNPAHRHSTWLVSLPAMAHRRAPGSTCLGACQYGFNMPNDSHGCGGIMRVAPAGLLEGYPKLAYVADAAAYMAELTHKHPFGYMPAALMATMVRQLLPLTPQEAALRIENIVEAALETLQGLLFEQMIDYKKTGRFSQWELDNYRDELRALTHKAMSLAKSDTSDHEAIRLLGEGWTGEEAWAISLFCLVRHIDSPKEAIIAAVNHDGDSDSTGSITGNMIGALHGYEALKSLNLFCPEGHSLEQTLELSEIILALADDLTTGCIISDYSPLDTPEKKQWDERYCEIKPAGIKEKD